MANWNYKKLDAITATCRIYSRNPALPDSCRESFAKAFELSTGWKRSVHTVTAEQVELAFNLMREACQTTGECECPNLSGARIFSCPLIREEHD